LVGEAAVDEPARKAGLVIRCLSYRRVRKRAVVELGVSPVGGIGVLGRNHWPLGLEHPCGQRADVEDYRMPRRRLHEVLGGLIEQTQLPVGLAVRRRAQLGGAKARKDVPWLEVRVVRTQLMQVCEQLVMERMSTA